MSFAHINSSSCSIRGNVFAIRKLRLTNAIVHLGILAVSSDVHKTTCLTFACTLCIVISVAHHVLLEILVALAVEGGSTAKALQTKLINTVLEVCDVLMCVKGFACLFGYTIADGKLVACPEVAVVCEVGILDDSKEACIARVFLSADRTETIFEVVVWNDDFVVVGVGHARRVNRAVAKHLAFGIDLCMTVREGQRLVVDLTAIIEVLEPCNSTLVAIELVAKCAVHNLVIADKSHLLLYLACAVVV